MSRTIENPTTRQQLTFLISGAENGRRMFRAEGQFAPGGFAGVDRIRHPDEQFEVLAGRGGFRVAGRQVVLGAGETIDVPAGTAHTFWNDGNEPMRAIFEFRPAPPSTERFYEIYFGLAQEGRVYAKSLPGLLDLALVWPETSPHAVLATPPAWIQHLAMRLLRPVARLARRRRPTTQFTSIEQRSAA